MIIYAIINTINGKMYIGQTKQLAQRRQNDHWRALVRNKHENPHLQSSWNKHGTKNFKFEVIQECLTQDEADWFEIYWIETLWKNLYNLKSGGKDCWTLCDESRERMSVAQKKIANTTKGLLQRREASAILWKGTNNKYYRKKRSIDSKAMWDTCNDKTRQKMLANLQISSQEKSEFSKKAWESAEYRLKFEKNYGFVISPQNKIYEVQGLRKFSKKHNLDPSTLSNMLNGKRNAKQHKGWRKFNG